MSWLLALAFCPGLAGCGYRVAGRGDQIPSTVRTIAVVPFTNVTSRYKIDQFLTSALTHEFVTRTRFRVVADEAEADAALRGAITNILISPVLFDPVSGRSTASQLVVLMRVSLTDRKSGQVLYQNLNLKALENYEVAIDPRAYFEESDIGLQRMSGTIAATVVSAILEKF